MSGPVMNNINNVVKMILATGLLTLLAACNPASDGGAPAGAEPPLAGAKIGGSFTLTNQDGGKTSDTDFKGQYRIIYFGYSYCPDVCPVDLANIMLGLKQVEKDDPALARKIQPIFISVDPGRDTPDVLKQYVSAFHPRLIGLTGSAEEIAAVAKKYLILYDIRNDEGSSEYLVDHSRQAYLFGPEGEPLALLPFDGTPQQVADEIIRWAR
ncbi:SCO family protein [Sphingopyxis sp. BSNA05]|uniref:SCO family protein n=1 Tax=Sphingopyxis sp. BSNA05 TaxID=1236614 RepID=UPI001564FCC4|nr:SCO family protein [Sphingopyxis sp. BSNA05]NRD89960.1 SCO family protein [Sphingopyxis sp. BSNA05]